MSTPGHSRRSSTGRGSGPPSMNPAPGHSRAPSTGQPSMNPAHSRAPSGGQPSMNPAHSRASSTGQPSLNPAHSRAPSTGQPSMNPAADFTNPNRNPPPNGVMRGPLPAGAYGPVRPGPVNKPCIAVRNYYDKTYNTHLRKDDAGVIRRTNTDSSGQRWGLVSIPSTNTDIWVPAECLRFNDAVYYGEVRYGENDPLVDVHGLNLHQVSHDTQLGRAVNAELLAWDQQSVNLGLADNDITKLKLSDPQRRHQLVTRILQGCKEANSYDILNNKDFTIQDLSRLKPAQDSPRSGIYLNLYSEFRDDRSRKPAIRTGKALSLQTRIWNHNWKRNPDATYNGERTHYTTARKASNHDDRVVCFLAAADHVIAEQLFVNLLETWAAELISDNFAVAQSFRITSGPIDKQLADAGDKHAFAVEARKHRDLSAEVARVTGWPGGVSRASFGASSGLNVTSPLTEMGSHDKTLWTRTDLNDRFVFTAHPRNPPNLLHVRSSTQAIAATHGEGKEDSALHFVLEQQMITKYDLDIDTDTLLTPRIEIFRDGKPHPDSFAQLSGLKTWSDHDTAASVAVFYRYQDKTGNWRELCIKASWFTFQHNHLPGYIWGQVKAMKIYRYLMQERYAVAFADNFDSTARVHKLVFDHFSQQVSFKEIFGPEQPRPHPRRMTQDEVTRQLKDAGAINLATESGWRPIRLPGTRESCDRCYAIKAASKEKIGGKGQVVSCVRVSGTDLCLRCVEAGSICSFTPWVLQRLQDFFRPKIHDPYSSKLLTSSGKLFEHELS